jgi:hypothetical protein
MHPRPIGRTRESIERRILAFVVLAFGITRRRNVAAMMTHESLSARRFRGAVVTYLLLFVAINGSIVSAIELLAGVRWTPQLRNFVTVWILFTC